MLPLKHITVQTTNACEFQCPGCFIRKNNSSIDYQILIDKIINPLPTLGGRSIGFTGGEPLLYHRIYDALSAAKGHGLRTSLVSHGGTINSNSILKLKEVNLDSLQISLDSIVEEDNDRLRFAGSLKYALNAVKLATNEGINVSLVAVPNKSLLNTFEEYVQNAIDNKIKKIYLRRIVDYTKDKDIVRLKCSHENFLEKVHKVSVQYKDLISIISNDPLYYAYYSSITDDRTIFAGCMAGISSLAISAEAIITPCTHFPLMLADLHSCDIKDVWENDERLLMLRQRTLKGKCAVCLKRYSCGGCRASAYLCTEDYLQEDKMCNIIV